jgi:hypothetical protein
MDHCSSKEVTQFGKRKATDANQLRSATQLSVKKNIHRAAFEPRPRGASKGALAQRFGTSRTLEPGSN